MVAIPDRFDLWVRRARTAKPERHDDLLLGSLIALPDWYFLNQRTIEAPVPASVGLDRGDYLLVFSHLCKLEDCWEEAGRTREDPIPYIKIPATEAIVYCLSFQARGLEGIMVNPGDYAFAVGLERLKRFYREWKEKSGRSGQGFWIPNMTSEEEDFWQEHGL